jgi:hypothetical protein
MKEQLRKMGSTELLKRAARLAKVERRITAAFVETLCEIDSRRIFSEEGYASLWAYVTKGLGLSESSAQRRIQAARLVRDAPEAKPALENGTLSLSNAAQLQGFRQRERKKKGKAPDAGELIQATASLSQRECEAALIAISPEAMPNKERDRPVSPQGDHELKFTVSKELYDKLQKIKGLIAHAKPEASYAELLEHLADSELKRLGKKTGIGMEVEPTRTAAAEVEKKNPLPRGKRVYLPAAIKRAVGSRSGGRCEFTTHEGRRCSSTYRLQIDPIVQLAHGGSNDLANLRQLCRNHNLAVAKMTRRTHPTSTPNSNRSPALTNTRRDKIASTLSGP